MKKKYGHFMTLVAKLSIRLENWTLYFENLVDYGANFLEPWRKEISAVVESIYDCRRLLGVGNTSFYDAH